MFKLSKESKGTFLALLIIPCLWIGLNHFGYLEYLKTKSVDLRMQFRGEIPQSSYIEPEDKIELPDGSSVPRVPKLVYVNFDSATLGMDNVGERPWDRAFFRDTALALIDKGKARSIGFDFGFTPKSMSSMVPRENSYRSDMAMAELVRKYPDQVVLGCLYSGVQTSFVKPTGVSAFPPFIMDGYSYESGKFHYPESPTYPLITFQNDAYVGRMGSFTVTPYRAVDDIPRWVPLWYHEGGKAHAYNLLGGKQSVLSFELPSDNKEEIIRLSTEFSAISERKQQLEEVTALLAELATLEEIIANYQNSLDANPALDAVIRPQLDLRLVRKKELLAEFELKKSDVELATVEADEARVQTQLNRIKGLTPTQLVEANDTLRLVYQDTVTSSDGAGLLVHSLPNEVPLIKQGKIFALGVEALLAYYGLDQDAVEIDDDYQRFRIVHPTEGALVESKLSDGQFLEVNWFSRWTETDNAKLLTQQAKRAYADQNIPEYLKLVPQIIRLLLSRIDGLNPSSVDTELLEDLVTINIEEDNLMIAERLLSAKPESRNIPNFEAFSLIIGDISYYLLPKSISSKYNPMCGMNEVLENNLNFEEVAAKIAELETTIEVLAGDQYLGKVESALEKDPENTVLLSQKQQVAEHIADNQKNSNSKGRKWRESTISFPHSTMQLS